MPRERMGAGIAGVVFCLLAGAGLDSANAACRQMLAPNGWQYVTVCDGYRSNNNYGAAAAAAVTGAAIAIEVLPGLLDSVGGITSSVGDLTSGAVENLGNTASNAADPLQNFLSSTNRDTGGQNNGNLNPFSIFAPQTSQPTPPTVRAPNVNTPNEPTVTVSIPNIFAPAPPANPNVRAPNVNTPSPVNADAPTVFNPFPNIFGPPSPPVNPNVRTPRTNTPQVTARQPSVSTPHVNSAQPQ